MRNYLLAGTQTQLGINFAPRVLACGRSDRRAAGAERRDGDAAAVPVPGRGPAGLQRLHPHAPRVRPALAGDAALGRLQSRPACGEWGRGAAERGAATRTCFVYGVMDSAKSQRLKRSIELVTT